MTDGFKASHVYKQQTEILFSRLSKSSSEPSRTRLSPWALFILIWWEAQREKISLTS